MAETTDSERWERYYRAVQGRQPRQVFVAALATFAAEGFEPAAAQAVDLGCGDGTETLALLEQGWSVLAIDQQAAAIARVQAAAPQAARSRLETQVAAFADATLPPADLIYAGLSLPFCPPADFPAVWNRVIAALRPGGRFAGHLFGERDGWRDDPAMTFFSLSEVQQLLAALRIETLTEIEEERPTALGEPKHWHVFEIIAGREPGT